MRTVWFVMTITITALAGQLAAQAPVSNLYLFDMARQGDSSFTFSKPKYLTFFNANGYNNHPFFVSSDEILISSQFPGDEQPDIVRISLRDSSLTHLTKTAEGEYSPKSAALDFNPGYYAIRMEFQGKDTLLRLWKIPFDPKLAQFQNSAYPVFQDHVNVGYYEFGPSSQVALHLNGAAGAPNSLALSQVNMGKGGLVTNIATNIGRCFRFLTYPAQLIYLQKNPGARDMLMSVELGFGSYSSTPRQARPIVAPVTGSQDFAVLQDGTLLMAAGSRLFKYKPGKDTDWITVADFSGYQLNKITRLEVNRENNRIILVN